MAEDGYVPRLKEHYDLVVRASLGEKFGYANAM
ncbi:MAG: 50S ribosomal protein L5, partial [Pseudomonadota bacterium]|nr:50S ribosomal protein L5 [Pseudomonadota bacterium]